MTENEGSLLAHLAELRNALLRGIAAVLLIFLSLIYFAQDIYHWLATPLMVHLPAGTGMIATDVGAPFFAPFKLTMMVAFAAAVPFLLHQIWRFIAPGLYQHEKRLVAPLLISSTLLFYGGIAFAYYLVLPLAFAFFTSMAPEGITIATDITSYLNFTLKIFFAFGIAFEVPVVILLLCWTGATTPQQLQEKRAYVIVAAFVIGMVLTPPDIISQTLLAIPMWLLFELGLVFARFYTPSNKAESAHGDES